MFILRGLPGSGKTTLAQEIQSGFGGVIVSADDFFVGEDGIYRYDPTLQNGAHSSCQARADVALSKGSNVIVDNTNSRRWEMEPYLKMAKKHQAEVMILNPTTPWAADPVECADKTLHRVPLSTIIHMFKRWEP